MNSSPTELAFSPASSRRVKHLMIGNGRSIFPLASYAIFAGYLFWFGFSSSAVDYRFDGIVTYHGFADESSNPSSVIQCAFSVLSSSTNWVIKTANILPDAPVAGVLYDVASSDGTNIYAIKRLGPIDPLQSLSNRLHRIDERLTNFLKRFPDGVNSPAWNQWLKERNGIVQQTAMARTNATPPRNDAVGIVIDGTVPEFDPGLVAPLWFALTPQHFENRLPLIWSPRPQNARVTLIPGQIVKSDMTPNLISQADFFANDGVSASYRTSDWVTDHATAYPKDFVLKVVATEDTNRVLIRIFGVVTSAVVAAGIDRPVQDFTNVVFRDERFRTDKILKAPLIYAAPGPISTKEAMGTPEYSRAIKRARRGLSESARITTTVFLIAFAIAPLGIFIFKRIRHSRANPNKPTV